MGTAEENNENAPIAFLLVVCAGLSTGIGAGFVFNKRLVSGSGGEATIPSVCSSSSLLRCTCVCSTGGWHVRSFALRLGIGTNRPTDPWRI